MWMAPMGIGTIQPRWGGGLGEGAIRRSLVARYARAPKLVIHLKISQEITRVPFQGKPGRVGPPGATRNISETARAIQARRNDFNMGNYGLGGGRPSRN